MAVSGGIDSTALALVFSKALGRGGRCDRGHLANGDSGAGHLREADPVQQPVVQAAVVDHGLREGSGEEAVEVARRMREAGAEGGEGKEALGNGVGQRREWREMGLGVEGGGCREERECLVLRPDAGRDGGWNGPHEGVQGRGGSRSNCKVILTAVCAMAGVPCSVLACRWQEGRPSSSQLQRKARESRWGLRFTVSLTVWHIEMGRLVVDGTGFVTQYCVRRRAGVGGRRAKRWGFGFVASHRLPCICSFLSVAADMPFSTPTAVDCLQQSS